MRQTTGHLEDFCGISTALCIWQSLVRRCSTLLVPEEYSYAVFLGDDFRICRIQLFTWFDSGYIFCVSLRRPGGFHAFRVKVDLGS